MLALLFLLGIAAAETVSLAEVLAPFIVQLRENFELLFEILIAVNAVVRFARALGWRLPFYLDARGIVLGKFFQQRVLLKLFMNEGVQLQRGDLQEMQTLLELRRQYLLQR